MNSSKTDCVPLRKPRGPFMKKSLFDVFNVETEHWNLQDIFQILRKFQVLFFFDEEPVFIARCHFDLKNMQEKSVVLNDNLVDRSKRPSKG